tara:strand:+ start:506 stop:790 length:285 start_codon:yes stop_codon:yes gene_type:complete
MKYLRTLNVSDYSIQEAIKSGQIKLQVGQWLICGTGGMNGEKCRYVSHSKNSLNVVHWQGTAKATDELFRARLSASKETLERMLKRRAKRLLKA